MATRLFVGQHSGGRARRVPGSAPVLLRVARSARTRTARKEVSWREIGLRMMGHRGWGRDAGRCAGAGSNETLQRPG